MAGSTWKRDDVATQFLSERSHVVPDRHRQLEVLLRALRAAERPPARVLDLGAGDGILLAALLEAFPDATGVAVDFSPPMLNQARVRLSAFGSRATVAEADLNSSDWLHAVEGPFDAVVSGLAIHHLPDERKRALYREIFDLLRPGGVFLNCEHVAGRGPWGERLFEDAMGEHLWLRRTERGEAVSLEQVRTEYVTRPDRVDNILALVEEQCDWLRAIGFVDVDCFWKYFEFAFSAGDANSRLPAFRVRRNFHDKSKNPTRASRIFGGVPLLGRTPFHNETRARKRSEEHGLARSGWRNRCDFS